MCQMCDGMTLDEVREDLNRRIDRFGWVLQAVEDRSPWVYTIGLLERFGHPELVMAGIAIEEAGFALNDLGRRIEDGERFGIGAPGIEVEGVAIEIAAVHPVHVGNGLVAVWDDHYAHAGRHDLELEVVQVLAVGARKHQPRLSRPYVTLGRTGSAPGHRSRRRR